MLTNWGKKGELSRRHNILFERFLYPGILRSVQFPKINDELKEILKFVYKKSGRSFKSIALMGRCNDLMKKHYEEELDRLCEEEPLMQTLMSYPWGDSKLDMKQMTHGQFMERPRWASEKDLPAAVRALQQVGVIESAEMFCDLIQTGYNRLLPSPDPSPFDSGPTSIKFWIALVLLWSIAIQEKIEKRFNNDMKELEGDAFMHAPGIKSFSRSFENALSTLEYQKTSLFETLHENKKLEGWDEKVYVGLHVIDGLRCSYTVDSVEANIALGRRLEAKFPVVRTMNNHKMCNLSYADRKYNILYRATVEGLGEVAFICEVQIIMKQYLEIKKLGNVFSWLREWQLNLRPPINNWS